MLKTFLEKKIEIVKIQLFYHNFVIIINLLLVYHKDQQKIAFFIKGSVRVI